MIDSFKKLKKEINLLKYMMNNTLTRKVIKKKKIEKFAVTINIITFVY